MSFVSDATHINIPAPKEFEGDYYDRHGNHSIVAQATCDEELQITSLYTGFPGVIRF